MYLSMMKMKKCYILRNTYVFIWLFLHLQVSQSISVLLFRLVFIWLNLFLLSDCQKRDKRRKKKCWTATTVTSLSRRHMTCHFGSGWCVMMRATRKERPIMYMIAMPPLCWEVSSVSFCLTLHIWLSFIPQVRPPQSSWLYIRNTHTHTLAYKEESGFLVRLVSRFLDLTDGSSFWIIVVSCCRCSYCCYSDDIFSFLCFLIKKKKRQIL